MGRPPIQIDIINQADGIDIRDCYERRQIIRIDDLAVSLISRSDLILNKLASGRLQDLADAEKTESRIRARPLGRSTHRGLRGGAEPVFARVHAAPGGEGPVKGADAAEAGFLRDFGYAEVGIG